MGIARRGNAERVAPTVRARALRTVGACARYAHVVWSERAGVSACVDQCLPVLSGDTDAFCPRPQIDETQGPKHAFDFSRTRTLAFCGFAIRDFRSKAEPRLRFNPFSARATGPPAAPRASLSNEHAHVRFTMGATTSRCEEAEAEPVQEVRSAVRCLRLQVSISFLPVSFAVQAALVKKKP